MDQESFTQLQRDKLHKQRKSAVEGFGFRQRREPNEAEKAMMAILKEMGLRFLFEYPLWSNILDFYLPSLSLAIEVDGNLHNSESQKLKDSKRDRYLVSRGLQVIRFTNEQAMSDPETCKKRILATQEIGVHPRMISQKFSSGRT